MIAPPDQMVDIDLRAYLKMVVVDRQVDRQVVHQEDHQMVENLLVAHLTSHLATLVTHHQIQTVIATKESMVLLAKHPMTEMNLMFNLFRTLSVATCRAKT
jgi:hypothetical protein